MRVISKEELLCVSGSGGRDDRDNLQQMQDQQGETWGDIIVGAVGDFFSGVGTAISDCSSGATSGAAMFGGYGATVAGPVGAAAAGVVGAAGGCVVNTGVGVISAIGEAAGK